MYSHRFPLKRDIWKFRVVILCAMISTAKKKKKKKKKLQKATYQCTCKVVIV